MRDIFEEIFENQPLDPTESARRNMRPQLRTRFYQAATVGEGPEGFPVLLDGRPVRTPARRLLAAPVRELAAGAWPRNGRRSSDKVDPAAMPLTRLANSIIDGVAPSPEPVAAEIEKYLGTDLLFYRADGPDGLVASQRRHWDPVIDWARETLGARFVLVEGIVHVAQPEAAIAAAAAIPRGANIRRRLAARRAQRRHHADRLGAAGAGACRRPHHDRRGMDRGACRRGLEHGVLGPRRARPGAPRLSLRRDAGGGGWCLAKLALVHRARALRISDRARPRAHGSPWPRRRAPSRRALGRGRMRRRELGVALDRLVEARQRVVEPAERLQRHPAADMGAGELRIEA